jgi:hypothetical protein
MFTYQMMTLHGSDIQDISNDLTIFGGGRRFSYLVVLIHNQSVYLNSPLCNYIEQSEVLVKF